MAQRSHAPSAARALVAEAKRGGRPLGVLVAEARAIDDAGHAATALFHLSSDRRLPLGEAEVALSDCAGLIARVERGWRRAELLTELLPRLAKWRGGDADAAGARSRFEEAAFALATRTGSGDHLAALLGAAAAHLAGRRLPDLLDVALRDGGPEEAKAVLRGGASREPEAVAALAEAAGRIPEPALRARLLGYLHGQLPESRLFENAALAALAAPPEHRLEALRALAQSAAQTVSELERLRPTAADPPEVAARLLGTLAGKADRLGARDHAIRWLNEAEQQAGAIPDTEVRAGVRRNLATAYERLGDAGAAQRLRGSGNEEGTEPGGAVGGRPARAPGGPASSLHTGSVAPSSDPPSDPSSDSRPRAMPANAGSDQRAAGSSGTVRAIPGGTRAAQAPARHVFALYDTYEGRVSDVHLRAVARAAPLCIAFDLDLALLGFPTTDLARLVDDAARETNVGGGGRFVKQLAGAGRIRVVACTTREAPRDWSGIGLPVATTSEPDPGRRATLPQAVQAAAAAGFGRVCLVMGLGRRGLPASMLKAAALHYEITGRNVPFETATAMGILADRLGALGPGPAPDVASARASTRAVGQNTPT